MVKSFCASLLVLVIRKLVKLLTTRHIIYVYIHSCIRYRGKVSVDFETFEKCFEFQEQLLVIMSTLYCILKNSLVNNVLVEKYIQQLIIFTFFGRSELNGHYRNCCRISILLLESILHLQWAQNDAYFFTNAYQRNREKCFAHLLHFIIFLRSLGK